MRYEIWKGFGKRRIQTRVDLGIIIYATETDV